MNIFKSCLFILIFGQISLAFSESNICYFSLNNEKEYSVMKSFSKEISINSSNKFNVTEYQKLGSNPVKSFLNMLKTGKKCDGLVISGHHTGSFGGSRASGNLGIDFLENLSCKPEHENWFNNLSAVWLQGCRTLGVTINAEEYEDFEEDADFHTARLEDLLAEDHLEQSLETLNTEFSAVLDQDNPLSTRYLRAFPNATIFGWTQTAPGVKARSEKSLPFHIAHISRILDPTKENTFNDPFSKMNKETKLRYSNVLNSILTRSSDNNYVVKDRISEEVLIDGWLEHGQAIGNFPFSFNNPDLQAYKSLSSGRPLLVKAKSLGCNLRNNKHNKRNLSSTLKKILVSKKMIFYNMDTISSLLEKLKSNKALLDVARETLKESQNFVDVLSSKLTRKGLGITRLLEYYSLYTIIKGKRSHRFENIIKRKAIKILSEGDNEEYNIRDYKESLLKSLYVNRIFTDEYLIELIPYIKDSDMVIRIISLGSSRITLRLIKKVTTQILESKNLTIKDKFHILNDLTYTYEEMYNHSDYSKHIKLFISTELDKKLLTDSGANKIYDYLLGIEETNEFLALEFYKKYIESLNQNKRYSDESYRLHSIIRIIFKKKYRDAMDPELLKFYLDYSEHALSYKIKTDTKDDERLNEYLHNKKIITVLKGSSLKESLTSDLYDIDKFGNSYYQIESKVNFLPDTTMSLDDKFKMIKNIANWLDSTTKIHKDNKASLFIILIESLSSMNSNFLDVMNTKELHEGLKDLIRLYISNHQKSSSNFHYTLFSCLSGLLKSHPKYIGLIGDIFSEIISRSIETKNESNHWNLVISFLKIYSTSNIKEIPGLDILLTSIWTDPSRPPTSVFISSDVAFKHVSGEKRLSLLKSYKKLADTVFSSQYQIEKIEIHLISAYFQMSHTIEDKIEFYTQNNTNSKITLTQYFANSIQSKMNIKHENYILNHKLYHDSLSPYDTEGFDNDYSSYAVHKTTYSLVKALTNNQISKRNKKNIINYIMNAGYLTFETLYDLISVIKKSDLGTDYKLQFIDKVLEYISHFKGSDKFVIFLNYEETPIRNNLLELVSSLDIDKSLTSSYITEIFSIPSFNNFEYLKAMNYLKETHPSLHEDQELDEIFNESLFQSQKFLIQNLIFE